MSSSQFIEQQKKLYKSLKPCYCQALQETVYFNSTGLNHILYHRRRPRSHSERHYRASLICYIVEVISGATQAIKEIKSEDPFVITWSIQHSVLDKNKKPQIIKVILIKEGAGNVYFLSVMKKKNDDDKNEKTQEKS